MARTDNRQKNKKPPNLLKLRGYYGRGERIWTSGPCLPKAVLYQAELHPDVEIEWYVAAKLI